MRTHHLARIDPLDRIKCIMVYVPILHGVIPVCDPLGSFDKIIVVYFRIVNGEFYTVSGAMGAGIHVDCVMMNANGLNAC